MTIRAVAYSVYSVLAAPIDVTLLINTHTHTIRAVAYSVNSVLAVPIYVTLLINTHTYIHTIYKRTHGNFPAAIITV